MRLSDFSTLTFDCYGTLIDWESGMMAALAPLLDRAQGLDRNAVLEAHARHESGQQALTPHMRYSDLLAIVHKRLAEEWDVGTTWEECEAYGRSVPDWPAFEDSADALARLGEHFHLVILSNVDNRSFAGSAARLKARWTATVTAEDVGAYKPSDRNFEHMLARLAPLGIERGAILHTAESLFHDHVPAGRHDLARAWIHRRHAQGGFGATMDPGETPHTDFRFTSMAAMAEAHEKEIR